MEEERESKEERGREGEKRKEEEREAVSYTTGHYRTRQTLKIHNTENSNCLQWIQSDPALLALPSVLGGLGVHHFH